MAEQALQHKEGLVLHTCRYIYNIYMCIYVSSETGGWCVDVQPVSEVGALFCKKWMGEWECVKDGQRLSCDASHSFCLQA